MKRGVAREKNKDGVSVCFRGHAMTEENTYSRKDRESDTECKECRRLNRQRGRYYQPVIQDRRKKPPLSSYVPAPREEFIRTGKGVY